MNYISASFISCSYFCLSQMSDFPRLLKCPLLPLLKCLHPRQFYILASRWPRCQRICMCRSHQSVAMLLGRSCMCLEKTLTQHLQAIGGRGWGDTTPCTVNWCKKARVPDQLQATVWAFRISLSVINRPESGCQNKHLVENPQESYQWSHIFHQPMFSNFV